MRTFSQLRVLMSSSLAAQIRHDGGVAAPLPESVCSDGFRDAALASKSRLQRRSASFSASASAN